MQLQVCSFSSNGQQAIGNSLATASGVVITSPGASGSDRRGLVVDVLVERQNGRLSLAGAGIEAAPSLVEAAGALEAFNRVAGKGE
jgi:hypothetical protein